MLETLSWYRPEVNQAQLNLLDSHDVSRALHIPQGDVEPSKLAVVLLFVLPGVSCLYYDTEIGLVGGAEPACREAFPWAQDDQWAYDLHALVGSLSYFRQSSPALTSVKIDITLLQGSEGCQGLQIVRGNLEHEQLIVMLNRSRRTSLTIHQNQDLRVV